MAKGNSLLNGYNPPGLGDNAWVWATQPPTDATGTLQTVTIRKWNPPQLAMAAVPPVPATPAQLNYIMKKGWNTWARSVEAILPGEFIGITVNSETNGIFLGLGIANKEGHALGTFKHGVLIDLTGVWVFESGVKVKLLRSTHTVNSTIRICRHTDNTIVYLIITGSETLIYASGVKSLPGTIYGYGFIYASGDAINSADLIIGEVQFGSV